MPVEVASLIMVCEAGGDPYYPRILNISDMSLQLEYDPHAELAGYEAASSDDDPLTKAALAVARADARVGEGEGWAILPAGAGMTLDLTQASSADVLVTPHLAHTEAAFYVRTASDLFGQLPWNELGNADFVGAQVSACALGALAMVQENEVPTIEEAIEQAEACKKAAREVSDAWKRRQQAAAPAADDILRGMSREASKGTVVADDLAKSAKLGQDVLVRLLRSL